MDSLSPIKAAEKITGDTLFLDVRLEQERADGKIAGSVHIPLTELSSRASELDLQRPVVVYCQSGSRAMMAADALRGVGFQVTVLEGGMKAWKEAGLPFESENT